MYEFEFSLWDNLGDYDIWTFNRRLVLGGCWWRLFFNMAENLSKMDSDLCAHSSRYPFHSRLQLFAIGAVCHTLASL